MSTRYTVPTEFADVPVGRAFALHYDGTPSHVKVSDLSLIHISEPTRPY